MLDYVPTNGYCFIHMYIYVCVSFYIYIIGVSYIYRYIIYDVYRNLSHIFFTIHYVFKIHPIALFKCNLLLSATAQCAVVSTNHLFYVLFPNDTHPGCLQFLVTTNNIAMSILVHMPLSSCLRITLGYRHWSGISVSQHMYLFNLTRYWQIVSQNGRTHPHSYQQCKGFPLLQIINNS